MIIKKSILSIIIAASIIILTTTPGLTYAQQPQNQTLTPAQQRHQELIELHAAQQQQQQGQAPPLIPTTPQQQLPQAQTPTQPRTLPTPDWNPMVPGPIPTPPPTSDPDLIRFNELFAQCKAGQDYVVSGQANSYDHDNQNRCIMAMKNAITQFCEDFQTLDIAKCNYVNRPDVILFLEINDRIFGFGDAPTTGLEGLLLPPSLLP